MMSAGQLEEQETDVIAGDRKKSMAHELQKARMQTAVRQDQKIFQVGVITRSMAINSKVMTGE